MTSKQESRYSMHLVTRDYLLANAGITATLPSFGSYFTPIQTSIGQVQSIREQQEADKTGLAENKAQLRATLIALTMDVARKVVAYASVVNNVVLKNEVGYSESKLKKSADTILRDSCQVVYNRANSNLAALTTYGVTAAVLTTMQSAITAFNTSIPKPRLGITDKKQATDQLVVLLKSIDDNLDKIDTLVEVVKQSQPVFYKGYHDARKVVETGVGSLIVKGQVADGQSGEGLQGATVRFVADSTNAIQSLKGANSNGELVKRTAAKGGLNIKSLPEGTYTVTVSKPGYRDAVVTLNVSTGELNELDVKLEKK